MSISDIFSQRKKTWNSLIKIRKNLQEEEYTCPCCKKTLRAEQLIAKKWVCSGCNYYFPIGAKERLEMICDEDSFKEMYKGLQSEDPLSFPEYDKKLFNNQKKTGQAEAMVVGVCRIKNSKVAVGVLDSNFLMGSMGTVVGEKIVRITEYAMRKKLPLIIFSASGGARMQEGLFSLMQMAKTSAAIQRFQDAGGLFISYLTNPTTGGVSASYASLGDIIIAEPDALICFAGPRVIQQTIGQKLPDNFQRAEFLLEHGMIDMIVERNKMRQTLYRILFMHQRQ